MWLGPYMCFTVNNTDSRAVDLFSTSQGWPAATFTVVLYLLLHFRELRASEVADKKVHSTVPSVQPDFIGKCNCITHTDFAI